MFVENEVIVMSEELKKKYFKGNKLLVIPKKEKNKIELFTFLVTLFEEEKNYSEKEINEILLEVYSDYSILRRYLVDYQFLSRDKYGKNYIRVKN